MYNAPQNPSKRSPLTHILVLIPTFLHYEVSIESMSGESENSGQKESGRWKGGNAHALRENGIEIKCEKDPDHVLETGGAKSMQSLKKRKMRKKVGLLYLFHF